MLWWTLQQLKSSHAESRVKAARALGSEKQKKAVPALIESLEDEDPGVRLAVIEALGAIGHPASAEALVSALANPGKSDKNAEPQCEALAKAIMSVGVPAVKPLIQALASGEKEARRWAAAALGMIRDPEATGPLIERLEDSRSEVRKAAAAALGEIGDSRAAAPLIKALANRDMETRRAAADALGSLMSEESVDALARVVGDPAEPVQIGAIEALAKIGGLRAAACLRSAMSGSRRTVCEAAEAALKKMHFSPADAEERAELAVIRGDFEAAFREGEAAVPALIGALEFKDPQMRVQAADVLAKLRSPDSVQPLLEALKDHHASVQQSAAKALTGIGGEACAGLEASLSHYDASVVRLAAVALGEIGDQRSVPALADLIAANGSIPGEYPELFEAISAAVDSLARIVASSAARIPTQELQRITEMPDEIRLLGSSPKAIGCAGLRNSASEELRRRS